MLFAIFKKFFIFFLITVAFFSSQHIFTNIYELKSSWPVLNSDQNYDLVKTMPAHWVKIEEINSKAVWAIVVSEDWSFYEHIGVDIDQLKQALFEHIVDKKKLRGASTITQQVVKNLFLSKERSFIRKIIEWPYALLMDYLLSKKRILEIYLNIIDFGPNIVGIKKASKYYFDLDPIKLQAKEGAFLAMILPSPKRNSLSFRRKQLSTYANKIISQIIYKLTVIKCITAAEGEREMQRHFSWET